jgi:hypothetical protein
MNGLSDTAGAMASFRSIFRFEHCSDQIVAGATHNAPSSDQKVPLRLGEIRARISIKERLVTLATDPTGVTAILDLRAAPAGAFVDPLASFPRAGRLRLIGQLG